MDSPYNQRKELVTQTVTPQTNHTELLRIIGRGTERKG